MAVNDVYEVVQTPQAEEHLRQITYYIAVKLRNPGAAHIWDKIRKSFIGIRYLVLDLI